MKRTIDVLLATGALVSGIASAQISPFQPTQPSITIEGYGTPRVRATQTPDGKIILRSESNPRTYEDSNTPQPPSLTEILKGRSNQLFSPAPKQSFPYMPQPSESPVLSQPYQEDTASPALRHSSQEDLQAEKERAAAIKTQEEAQTKARLESEQRARAQEEVKEARIRSEQLLIEQAREKAAREQAEKIRIEQQRAIIERQNREKEIAEKQKPSQEQRHALSRPLPAPIAPQYQFTVPRSAHIIGGPTRQVLVAQPSGIDALVITYNPQRGFFDSVSGKPYLREQLISHLQHGACHYVPLTQSLSQSPVASSLCGIASIDTSSPEKITALLDEMVTFHTTQSTTVQQVIRDTTPPATVESPTAHHDISPERPTLPLVEVYALSVPGHISTHILSEILSPVLPKPSLPPPVPLTVVAEIQTPKSLEQEKPTFETLPILPILSNEPPKNEQPSLAPIVVSPHIETSPLENQTPLTPSPERSLLAPRESQREVVAVQKHQEYLPQTQTQPSSLKFNGSLYAFYTGLTSKGTMINIGNAEPVQISMPEISSLSAAMEASKYSKLLSNPTSLPSDIRQLWENQQKFSMYGKQESTTLLLAICSNQPLPGSSHHKLCDVVHATTPLMLRLAYVPATK